MVKTRQWLLNSKPTDMPTVTGSNPTFKLTSTDIPGPSASQALVKTLILSNDPAQRTWIVPGADPERLYAPPVEEGTPMASFGLAEVVQSGNEKELAVGSLVLASTRWSELSIHEIKSLQVVKRIATFIHSPIYCVFPQLSVEVP